MLTYGCVTEKLSLMAFLGPMKARFLDIASVYIEPMAQTGQTRVLVYLTATLTVYETLPCFRSAEKVHGGGLLPPTYLDKSL